MKLYDANADIDAKFSTPKGPYNATAVLTPENIVSSENKSAA